MKELISKNVESSSTQDLGKSENKIPDLPNRQYDAKDSAEMKSSNNSDNVNKVPDLPNRDTAQETVEKTPLSEERKKELAAKDIPENVIEAINSEEEATIYEEAGVEPTTINDNDVLVKTDIDIEQKDVFGRTNLQRMEQGLAPLDANGKPIELHHIGQKSDAPLVELTAKEHRQGGNSRILHDSTKESEIDREEFGKQRSDHWKARAEQFKNENV